MISTIITLALVGYIGLFFVTFLFGIALDIYMGDWRGLLRDSGFFLVFNSWLMIGFSIGMFIFGNLLNFLTEGNFAIQIFNPNKAGVILLVICISFNLIGKALMGKEGKRLLGKEEKVEIEKHKYVTLKSGQRVQIY